MQALTGRPDIVGSWRGLDVTKQYITDVIEATRILQDPQWIDPFSQDNT